MPNSLRAKLSKLRYKGEITQEEYSELINKLDGHDSELLKAKDKVIEQFKWERDIAISQLEEIGAGFGLDMKLWLTEHDSDLLDKVMQKGRTIIDEDGVMYKAILLKDIEDMKAEGVR